MSSLKFVKFQNFVKKQIMLKFGIKNALFGYFWARILTNYCHIWNHHPQICQIAKFLLKRKMLKFGVIFEISTLKFVQLQNFAKKRKIFKFGTKDALFGYFWARILTNYCHNWNQHPQICQISKFLEKTKNS